jgi:glycerol-1-phosphate dehydrogenase [NAD(P)+]
MSVLLLDRLLRGVLPDPDSANTLSVPTKSVVLSPSLTGAAADLVAGLGLGKRLLLISDPTTHSLLGQRIATELGTGFKIEELILPTPHADLATVERIEARQVSFAATGLVAVGSGTINDLCKYAAHRAGIPYVVFPTAPSMNGYTSVSAAIMAEGHKKSLPATAAIGVFADLGILAKAPHRMIQAGFGDSICRSTAQTDWLLAHLLLDQPYRQAPFALLMEDEAALLAKPGHLLQGDLGATELLIRNLILSGFGMTICGGSQPASQGEHLISHYLEMLPPDGWPQAFHGEQVAVATLTMARLQEKMLNKAAPVLRPTAVIEPDLVAQFGAGLGQSCWQGFSTKCLDAAQAEEMSRRLRHDWPMIKARLTEVRRDSGQLRQALEQAGAPTSPGDIGLATDLYRPAVLHAREIRDRFTFLDLAADSGYLATFAFAETAVSDGCIPAYPH